jgi:hypothetical protein
VKREHPDEDYPREKLEVVAYLTEETREVQRRDGHEEKSREEIVHHGIVKAI